MELREDLGDGLVLRRATSADAEALVVFNGEMHSADGPDNPDAHIAELVRSLLAGGNPAVSAGDFMVVVDRKGEIVSSLALLPKAWSYGGIPLNVGRIEFVGTRPDHRRRGLVRRQMEVAHRWCTERGMPIQAISGIPNYYRRFGYEMALDLWGGRAGYLPHVPALPDGAEEPVRFRPAVAADIPFLASLDGQARDRWLVTDMRDEAVWRYLLDGGRAERFRPDVRLIERPDGTPVGYLVHRRELHAQAALVEAYDLASGVSWLEVSPAVLRYFRSAGEALRTPDAPDGFQAISFALGVDHPVYRAIPDRLPRVREPYAWFLRVPDLPGFFRQIAPILEARLSASIAPGYTGEFQFNFYEDGLRVAFTGGRLEVVEPWVPDHPEDGGAWFPGLSFLQVLFGRRSIAELEHAAADCRVVSADVRVLLDILFPKRASFVWPVI